MSETESGTPHRMLLFVDMLDPALEQRFTGRTMTADEFESILELATHRLETISTLPEGVMNATYREQLITHLRRIVESKTPPFGYSIVPLS